MKKVKLLLGNITFGHLVTEELNLFKENTEKKALIHQLKGVIDCDSYEEAEKLGEHLICEFSEQFESYVIPSRFDGEIVLEQRTDLKVKEMFA